MIRLHLTDGGRKSAGYKGTVGDCAVRAVAIASRRGYRKTYREIYGICKAVGKGSPRTGVQAEAPEFYAYMKKLGFTWVPTSGMRGVPVLNLVTGALPKGRLVVKVQAHMCAVINGVIHDTHRMSGIRIYGYWKKD